MAVELLNTIPDVAWSKNPMRVEFSSDLKIEEDGELYMGYLGFWGVNNPSTFVGPVENSIMTLEMYGVMHQFTFKAVPILGNNELPVYNPSLGTTAWVTSLREYLLSNSVLLDYYNITLTNDIEWATPPSIAIPHMRPYLRFESKEKDDRVTIIFHPGNLSIIVSTFKTGKSPVYRKNLKIYAELWVYTGADKTRLMSANIPTDINGAGIWDISIPLHNHAQLTTTENGAKSGVVKYHLAYTDVYGDNQVVGNLMQGADKYVLYGGVPSSRVGESVTESLVQDNLLRWLNPSNIGADEVVIGQEYQLTLFNPGNIVTSVNVAAEIHYINDVYYELVLGTITIPSKSKIYVNALDPRIFVKYPDEHLLSWDIYLKDDEKEISERYRLELSPNHRPYIRHVKYINSYGSWSYMNLYGRAKHSYSIDRESVEIMTSSGKSMYKDINLSTRHNILLRSGYRSKKVIQSYSDLILSEHVLLFEKNIWKPICIKNNEILESEDGNHLYNLEIEVSFASKEYLWGL